MMLAARCCLAVLGGTLTLIGMSPGGEYPVCCPDNYKTKAMPATAPCFIPNGKDCYQIKTFPKTYPNFRPRECDEYQAKPLPKAMPHSQGKCASDGGEPPGFLGLRKRPMGGLVFWKP
ncbi:MAG: hypothetical protein EXR99_04915 [Gemmataceae bacterium]|nr:hypothetical protein [Gemmataceae bacterium]